MARTKLRIEAIDPEHLSSVLLELPAPPGYEFTGEYRVMRPGEYKYQDGDAIKVADPLNFLEFFILRKLESAKQHREIELKRIARLYEWGSPGWIGAVERTFEENPDEVTK